jgi:hypothetical protein
MYIVNVITVFGTVGYGVALTTRAVSCFPWPVVIFNALPVKAANERTQHISVMLFMQFLTGTSTSVPCTVTLSATSGCLLMSHFHRLTVDKFLSTLLTDLNSNQPATAQAASNFVRCLTAGGAIAILQTLVDAIGPAWCFTIYDLVVSLSIPLIWRVQRQGAEWRKERINDTYKE